MTHDESPTVPTEEIVPVYQQYDEHRRRRMLRILLPATAVTLLLGSLALIGNALMGARTSGAEGRWVVCCAIILADILSWLGVWAIGRRRFGLATALMLTVGSILLPAIVVAHMFIVGLDEIGLTQFMIFGVALVFVGLFGDRRVILATTLLLNIVTLLVVLLATPLGGLQASWMTTRWIVLGSGILFEWLFGSVILVQWTGYQGALRDLGSAYEQAQQVESLKDRFITHVNHELRTPIMTMDGYVETLLLGHNQMSAGDQQRALEKASHTGKLLVRLLESILDVRRIDENKVLNPEQVSISQTFESALNLLDPREGSLADRDVHIDMSPTLMVWGEPVRIQQILTNLLSNALKYSPAGSPIVVQARQEVVLDQHAPVRRGDAGRTKQSVVEVRVRDFGLGIPPEQIPLLFRRFVRLPRDLASRTPGNGLGLYLCRVFAVAMGGTLQVESPGIAGVGSTFILRLPAVVSEQVSEVSPSPVRQIERHKARAKAQQRADEREAVALAHQLDISLEPGAVLAAGQSARPFVAADIHGNRISLEDYRGRRVFLAFVRFAGCPFCGLHTRELMLRHPAFQAAGLETVVVVESTRTYTLDQPILREAPFPIIADPTGALYRLYGATASELGLQVALRQRQDELARAKELGLDGLVDGGPAHGDGVLERLPMEFVVGPDLRVEMAYYGKDIGDFLPLELVDQSLQISRTPHSVASILTSRTPANGEPG